MERIQRALKLRIYPTQEQQEFLDKTLGSCRFIYNQMLNERIQHYETTKNLPKEERYKHEFTTEKEWKEQFDFLKEVDSFALQQARRNLETAYSNFYKSLKGLRRGEQVGFPKFKSKHSHSDSYRTGQTTFVDFDNHLIRLPKCKNIEYKHHCSPKSWYRLETTELKNITISKSASGKYFASCLFEGNRDYGEPTKFEKVIGLDMSLQNCYIDSNGNDPEYHRNYRENEAKLAKEQQKLSRKTKGSKNWEKQRIKVARVHEKIANKRRDFNHKLSWKLVQENDVIVVENLNLKGMSQGLNLGKSVMDVGYGAFVGMLSYKAKWNEKTLIFADKWFASSKICHVCGTKNKDLMLHEREWKCPVCGTYHHRDTNAAINLKKLGISLVEHQEVLSESSNFAASIKEYPTL